MKKHKFLETMTAKEFVGCLEDFGLYSMAIDTMVSTIEQGGRNQNELYHGDKMPEHRKQIPIEMILEEVSMESDEIIASLNDPHDRTGRVDGNVDLNSGGSSGCVKLKDGKWHATTVVEYADGTVETYIHGCLRAKGILSREVAT